MFPERSTWPKGVPSNNCRNHQTHANIPTHPYYELRRHSSYQNLETCK
ncbi:NYN domain-containing protein [Psidium guajava]|nr:NYN domain-containing protein [Psidium guajava]